MKKTLKTLWRRTFLMSYLLITILVISLIHSYSFVRAESSAEQPDLKQLDGLIEGKLRELQSPGAAFVLVEKGEIVYSRGYGVADSKGRPVGPDTPFLLGSVTKPITALAVMQLVEAGKINLDEPVKTYLPWFSTSVPVYSDRITVRDLLHQTSGFSTLTGHKQMADFDNSSKALENHVRYLAGEDLNWGPGGGYQYSNANFIVLGLLVQTVSGQSYESYIQQKIFTPLEMTQSYTDQDAAEQAGMAEGVRFWFGQPLPARLPHNRGDLPAAYLISSANDMGKFIIAMLDGGEYQGRQLISSESLKQMFTPVAEIRQGMSYGMGWFVADRQDGTRLIQHNGNLANFHAEIWLCPEEEWGFALLMNANSAINANEFSSPAMGLVNLVAGRRLLPNPGSSSWLQTMQPLLIPLVITLVIILADILSLLKWSRRLETRPAGPAAWVGRLVLPILILVTVVLALLIFLPALMEYPVRFVFLFAPDAGVLFSLNLVLAVIWILAGSLWKIHVFRKKPA